MTQEQRADDTGLVIARLEGIKKWATLICLRPYFHGGRSVDRHRHRHSVHGSLEAT